jgi:predicted O-methyltransferase YrrM
MEFISQAADLYVQEHSTATSKLLQEIHDFTYQHHVEPHMLSGPVQGKFLSMISRMIKPKRVLEIGTFTGYSSLCLAEGLETDGVLHTIEMRAADAEIAQRFFDKSDYKSKIQLHVGDAHQLISSINEDWDLVFIDADKTGYIDYFNFLNEHVRPGTFLLFDNVLFHGEVLSENIKGKSAKAIAAFNEHLKKINNIDFVMLTIRDGITIIQKK